MLLFWRRNGKWRRDPCFLLVAAVLAVLVAKNCHHSVATTLAASLLRCQRRRVYLCMNPNKGEEEETEPPVCLSALLCRTSTCVLSRGHEKMPRWVQAETAAPHQPKDEMVGKKRDVKSQQTTVERRAGASHRRTMWEHGGELAVASAVQRRLHAYLCRESCH